jgi:hypothetical protein
MAQITDWPIPSGPSGLAMRQQVNLIAEALRTQNSGAVAPTPTVAGMEWFDTSVSPGVLKVRNSANDGWLQPTPPELTQLQAESATGVNSTVFGTVSGERLGQAIATKSGAKPIPASGAGQWINVNGTGNISIPAGGTWAYAITSYTSAGASYEANAGVVAGGTLIFPGGASANVCRGFAWRIA